MMRRLQTLNGLLIINSSETRSSSVPHRDRGEANHSNQLLERFLSKEEEPEDVPTDGKVVLHWGGGQQRNPPDLFLTYVSGLASDGFHQLSSCLVLSHPGQDASLPGLLSPQKAEWWT